MAPLTSQNFTSQRPQCRKNIFVFSLVLQQFYLKMERPPPQMRINLPSVTSELFFSSGSASEPIAEPSASSTNKPPAASCAKPVAFACGLPLRATKVEQVGDNESVSGSVDDYADADKELFVDISKELAAIEGTETLIPFYHLDAAEQQRAQAKEMTAYEKPQGLPIAAASNASNRPRGDQWTPRISNEESWDSYP